MSEQQHPLGRMLSEAASGRFPASDGQVEVLPAPDGVAAVVVAFSGHNVNRDHARSLRSHGSLAQQ